MQKDTLEQTTGGIIDNVSIHIYTIKFIYMFMEEIKKKKSLKWPNCLTTKKLKKKPKHSGFFLLTRRIQFGLTTCGATKVYRGGDILPIIRREKKREKNGSNIFTPRNNSNTHKLLLYTMTCLSASTNIIN
jgi:hypothetical protein